MARFRKHRSPFDEDDYAKRYLRDAPDEYEDNAELDEVPLEPVPEHHYDNDPRLQQSLDDQEALAQKRQLVRDAKRDEELLAKQRSRVAKERGKGMLKDTAKAKAKSEGKRKVFGFLAKKGGGAVAGGGAAAGAGAGATGAAAGAGGAAVTGGAVATAGTFIAWAALIAFVAGVFWVYFALGFQSSYQVFGRNEAALCPEDGEARGATGRVSGPGEVVSGLQNFPPDSEENRFKNAEQVANFLTSQAFKAMGNRPFSKEQAAAVLGNFRQESNWNPYAIQGVGEDAGPEVVQTWPNEKALQTCPGGGRALGILQMDGERCVTLVKIAMEMNTHWSDLNAQMEFIRREFNDINGMYAGIKPWFEKGATNYKEFPEPGRDVEFYTTAFNCSYERSADCPWPYRYRGQLRMIGDKDDDYRRRFNGNRIVWAKKFLDMWTPGHNTGGSTSAACNRGGSQIGDFNERIVAMARLLAYDNIPQSRGAPKPEYKKAKDELGGDSLYKSCDRFVATVIRSTVDKNIPWGNTKTQKDYLVAHPELWQPITDPAQLLPGDVIVKPTVSSTGHIVIFLGDPTENTVAHASINSRVGGIGNENRFRRDFGASFTQWTGFRYIGPDNQFQEVSVKP